MRIPGPSNGARRGFTLVEMMIVIIIVGILSASIVAEMHGTLQDALLRSTSRALIGAFNLASSRAVATNRSHRVRLDQTKHRFVLERKAGLDFAPLRNVLDSEGDLDSRISLQLRESEMVPSSDSDDEPASHLDEDRQSPKAAREEAITFYPDGTADAREVELRDQDGFGLALRINPITSRVQILEVEHK